MPVNQKPGNSGVVKASQEVTGATIPAHSPTCTPIISNPPTSRPAGAP